MHLNIILLIFIFFIGCSDNSVKDGPPDSLPFDIMSIPDAVPRIEPRTAAGNAESYEILGKRYRTLKHEKGYRARGIASWYGRKFHGKKTANGETYDMFAMTAAHRSLPIPSYARVTNLRNNRSVVVRINDRGPFHDNRIIDLSYTAAAKLDIIRTGTGLVEVVAIQPEQTKAQAPSLNSPTGNRLYLQIGAFTNEQNALQLQDKLKSRLPATSRLKIEQNNGQALYKVQLGPVKSEEQANQLFQQLTAMGIKKTNLVNDE